MQSTKFSRGTKEGRGDTSVWTDTPSDRAQKVKMKYVSSFILECFGLSISFPFNLYGPLISQHIKELYNNGVHVAVI